MHECNVCYQIKPATMFGMDRQKPDGRRRTCRPCDKARRSQHRILNLANEKARARKYRQTHLAETAKKKQAYQTTGRGKILMLAASRRYFHTSPRAPLYRRRNQAKYRRTAHGRLMGRIRCARRRARLLNCGTGLTTIEWRAIIERQEYRCLYCREPFTRAQEPTMDHMIPLSRGGQHRADNIAAACRRCNSKKGTKTLNEFCGARPAAAGTSAGRPSQQ